MNISIDSKKIITAIQSGLSATKQDIYTRNTLTDNRKHMQKWDDITTNIKNQFATEDNFSFIPLDRGLFKPVMIFDRNKSILYTVVKKQNYQKIMNRKNIQKAHYMDAMFDYNFMYQQTPRQLSLFESESMFSNNAEVQVNDLKSNIELLLSTHEIKKYITIVINFTGYTLTEIKAVMCSKWLEEIESEDWTESITPSYEEIEDASTGNFVQEDDIKTKISVKPTIKIGRDLA